MPASIFTILMEFRFFRNRSRKEKRKSWQENPQKKISTLQKKKDRLIEITVDGHISDDELADFVHIQEELEKISVAVETLQLWCERMVDTGAIDKTQYETYKRTLDQG